MSGASVSGDLMLRNPITGTAGCCARADEPVSGRVSGARTLESPRWPLASLASAARTASGHAAAAPPSRAINSRRLTSGMGSPSEPAVPAYRTLRLPRKHRQVLGVDLNRSESSRREPAHERFDAVAGDEAVDGAVEGARLAEALAGSRAGGLRARVRKDGAATEESVH